MDPLIALTLDRAGGTDRHGRDFAAGDTLRIEYQIDAVDPQQIVATEASVLWYTEGKGESDMGIHFFRRFGRETQAEQDLRPMRRLDVGLPNSPLSYDGVILKVRWCVRVRLFLAQGREFVEERPFVLGCVPAARAVPNDEPARSSDESAESDDAHAESSASER